MITAPEVFASEMLGTAVMVFLGVAVSIAGGLRGGERISGAAGWACAVFVGASLADASGAHLNPAITLAQAWSGRTDWSLVHVYVLGEFVGALLGATIVTIAFWSSLALRRDDHAVVGWFATSSRSPRPLAVLSECFATVVLVCWVLNPPQPSIGDGVFNFGNSGLGYAGIAIVVFVLSLGAGSGTGAALNPFRDLAPRIVYSLIFRSRGYGPAGWSYAIVPIVGPLLGAALAVPLSALLPLAR